MLEFIKSTPMETAIAGFLGALIGAGASLVGLVIQQHFQTKRELLKIAAELGLNEFKHGIELAKGAGGVVPPPSAYVIYHARLLEEMSKGPITAETYLTLGKERDEILAAINQDNKRANKLMGKGKA